jgi:hypothetical protein
VVNASQLAAMFFAVHLRSISNAPLGDPSNCRVDEPT